MKLFSLLVLPYTVLSRYHKSLHKSNFSLRDLMRFTSKNYMQMCVMLHSFLYFSFFVCSLLTNKKRVPVITESNAIFTSKQDRLALIHKNCVSKRRNTFLFGRLSKQTAGVVQRFCRCWLQFTLFIT